MIYLYIYIYIRSIYPSYIHIFQLSQLSPRREAELETEAQLEAALEAQQQATARYEAMAVGAHFSGTVGEEWE